MDAMQILVIILSVFLALFLLLSITLVILLIKVTRQIKAVTSSARRTVEKVEGIASNLGAATNVVSLAKVAKAFIRNFKNKED